MSIYKELLGRFDGVLEERELERVMVSFFKEFASDGDVFDDVQIYEGVRGFPLVIHGFENLETGDAIDAAKANANHLIISASGFSAEDGNGSCNLVITIATNVFASGGYDPDAAAKHEERCCAVRGIMSYASQHKEVASAVVRVNESPGLIFIRGWNNVGVPRDEFAGKRWIHTEEFTVTMGRRDV